MFEKAKKELKTNGSGVSDPTAYTAIRRTEGFEMSSDTYNDGDIVTVEKFNGTAEEMLLLKCHGSYASSVMLKELPPLENPIPVTSSQKMYTDGGRLGYTYYDTITGFVRALPQEELQKVLRGVAKALGIKMPAGRESTKEEPGDLAGMIRKVSDGVDIIGESVLKLIQMDEEAMPDAKRLIYIEAERDIYKNLYEQERARGGADK